MDTKTIGNFVRNARKNQGLTQAEAAGYLNVGIGNMSDKILGAAKETTEEFNDLYGESPVVKKINEVIQQSSKEKQMIFNKSGHP